MCAVTRETEPRFENDLTAEALKRLDVGALILERSGEITYANDNARREFGCSDATTDLFAQFRTVWEEPAATIEDALAQAVDTTSWHTFSVTPRAGLSAGRAVKLNARAIRVVDETGRPEIYILVMQEDAKSADAARDRALVNQLTAELESGARSEETLKTNLARQANLNRELIHRSKNNLALLVSLLRDTRRRLDQVGAEDAMTEFERRLISVAAVHDVLDGTQQTECVRADQLLARICEAVAQSLAPPGVTVSYDLAETELFVADANPLALIANELVTNALKHAFPAGRAGLVHVSLHPLDADRMELVVADDGVGALKPQPCQLGPVVRSKGAGLGIVGVLLAQLNGELVREEGAGTRCRVVFRPSELPDG
ncbi:sensor histidine kinase [Acuticoccus kandeliae]|uniref:sensor histidine kinase n=1 Tax=Acuticoccus kandeliae TaxID=2073160 RepID=UPI0014767FD0|nr:histidine kinase dimerization/phosphoacceptor domain -containing protein [Acuticoccus kandeliae]